MILWYCPRFLNHSRLLRLKFQKIKVLSGSKAPKVFFTYVLDFIQKIQLLSTWSSPIKLQDSFIIKGERKKFFKKTVNLLRMQ